MRRIFTTAATTATAQVVQHFDRFYDLGLSAQDRSDLVAYLDAVGDADKPYTRNDVAGSLDEIAAFASVLDTALPERNVEVINLTVDAVGNEWRELGEKFPGPADSSVGGGLAERRAARRVVLGAALSLREIAMAVAGHDYRTGASGPLPTTANRRLPRAPCCKAAEPWSLFNPEIYRRHFERLQQLNRLATADKLGRTDAAHAFSMSLQQRIERRDDRAGRSGDGGDHQEEVRLVHAAQ